MYACVRACVSGGGIRLVGTFQHHLLRRLISPEKNHVSYGLTEANLKYEKRPQLSFFLFNIENVNFFFITDNEK